MAEITKARIVIGTYEINLEGREEFVEKFLNIYNEQLLKTISIKIDNQPIKNGSKKENNDNSVAKPERKSKKKGKSIEAEKFDLFKDGDKPSLEEFLALKLPGNSSGNVIPAIAYYIQQIKSGKCFTEGNIEYAYRTLSLKNRPEHLRQIIINKKNEKSWFEETEDGSAWILTRAGEIFVDEKLPPVKS